MKNKILYICLMIVTIYLAVLYDFQVMRFLVAFELTLPVADGLLMAILGNAAELKVQLPSENVSKKEQLSVYVDVKNKSFLPIPSMEIRLEKETGFTYHKEIIPLRMMIDGKQQAHFLYETEAQYCGRQTFTLTGVRIWSYLGLFSRKKVVHQKEHADVMPVIREMDLFISEYARGYDMDADEYDDRRPGDDVSEIFQIRQYQSGDTIQRIHWKLSAREDELMVKDYGRPVGCSVLLLIDFCLEDFKDCRPGRLDSFVETVVSLSFSMICRECKHEAAWYGGEGQLHHMQIGTEEDVYELIIRLFQAVPYEEEQYLEAMYREACPEKIFPVVLKLDTALNLYRNGQEVVSFHDGRTEELEGYQLII